MSFGSRLTELRTTKGLSQQAFADAFGVAQSTVGNWEAGKREPNQETTIRLAQFFGVSVDWLIGADAGDCGSERMSLGSNIIALRKEKGISRKDLAKALNLPYTTLSSYETDQRLPSAKRLGEIANYFSVDIESVLADSEITPSLYSAYEALDKIKKDDMLKRRLLPCDLNDTIYVVHRFLTCPPVIEPVVYKKLLAVIDYLPFGHNEAYLTEEEANAALERETTEP